MELHPIVSQNPKYAAALAHASDAGQALSEHRQQAAERRAEAETPTAIRLRALLEEVAEDPERESRFEKLHELARNQVQTALQDVAAQALLAMEDREREVFDQARRADQRQLNVLAEELELLRLSRVHMLGKFRSGQIGRAHFELVGAPTFSPTRQTPVDVAGLVAAAEQAQNDRPRGVPEELLPDRCEVEDVNRALIEDRVGEDRSCRRQYVVAGDGLSAACPAHPEQGVDLSPTTLIGFATSTGNSDVSEKKRVLLNQPPDPRGRVYPNEPVAGSDGSWGPTRPQGVSA
jgi:hypothetical protein